MIGASWTSPGAGQHPSDHPESTVQDSNSVTAKQATLRPALDHDPRSLALSHGAHDPPRNGRPQLPGPGGALTNTSLAQWSWSVGFPGTPNVHTSAVTQLNK